MAAAVGVFNAMAQATAVEIAPPAGRGRSLSALFHGTTFGLAIGASAGASVAGLFGWRAAYLSIGGIALAAAVGALFMLPRKIRGQRQSLTQRLKVIALPGVVPGLIVSILFMVGPFSAIIYIAALASGAPVSLPLFLLAFGIGAVLGNFIGGRLTDRFGPRRSVTLTLLAIALNTIIVSVIPLLPAQLEAVAWPMNALFAGILSWTFYPPQVTWLASRFPRSAPLVLSLNGTAIQLGAALAALFGGIVIDLVGAGLLGLIGAISPLAAIWIASASYREDGVRPEGTPP
jgi:predicted MFS family arabinose efflux permease